MHSALYGAIFAPTAADPAASLITQRIVDGQPTLQTAPDIAVAPDGTAVALFEGFNSTVTGDPLNGGKFAALAPGATTWGPQTRYTTDSSLYSIAGLYGSDGVLTVAASPVGTQTHLYRGLVQDEYATIPTFGLGLALGRDSAGRTWVAGYSINTPAAIYMQQLDPATGALIGLPLPAPDSSSISNNTEVVMACAASCRIVYENSKFGSEHQLLSWTPGEASPTVVVASPNTQNPAAVYRPDGRLWVLWESATHDVQIKLGDARGAGGTARSVGKPAGSEGVYQMSAIAWDNDIVLAANFAPSVAGIAAGKKHAIWTNRVGEAPPTPDTSGPRVIDVDVTPDGKSFRIQVQYRVKGACTAPCRARGEIRVRSGRRTFATAPLPGDTKIVLGTRGGMKLPTGRKVRFYITVKKAQLLKTPFVTEKGYRIAETRLRVWLKVGASERLTVRDGRIRVSIARIKSGALPGLRGIL